RKGHTAFELRVINNGKTVNRTKVTGILRTFENVAVAKTTIDRGTRLNRTDFHLEKKETTYIPGDPMRAQHVVEAIESRVRIPKGKIIMQNMVADIPSVRKGETIQLEIKAGSVFLQTEALSQQDGAVDDIIRVWLQDTRKTLKGIVVGKGKVLVEL
ncbi:MAG: flagella basal body P-ring formation protein FlgA, partial [Calditrichaeota bacterium]